MLRWRALDDQTPNFRSPSTLHKRTISTKKNTPYFIQKIIYNVNFLYGNKLKEIRLSHKSSSSFFAQRFTRKSACRAPLLRNKSWIICVAPRSENIYIYRQRRIHPKSHLWVKPNWLCFQRMWLCRSASKRGCTTRKLKATTMTTQLEMLLVCREWLREQLTNIFGSQTYWKQATWSVNIFSPCM